MISIFIPHLPPAALSPNARPAHWSVRSRAAKAYRDTCYLYARNQAYGTHFERAVATVQVEVTDPTRRRDCDNYLARLKPLFDALVDAGIIPDDSAAHLTVRWAEPPFVACPPRSEGVGVVLEEAP